MLNSDRWISEVEVSEITGRALPTLRNERCAGRGIPYSKIGRSVRYLIHDVYKYMDDRKIQTRG